MSPEFRKKTFPVFIPSEETPRGPLFTTSLDSPTEKLQISQLLAESVLCHSYVHLLMTVPQAWQTNMDKAHSLCNTPHVQLPPKSCCKLLYTENLWGKWNLCHMEIASHSTKILNSFWQHQCKAIWYTPLVTGVPFKQMQETSKQDKPNRSGIGHEQSNLWLF